MRIQLLATFLFLSFNFAFSTDIPDNLKNKKHLSQDSVQWGMEYLKQITGGDGQWVFNNPKLKKSIDGLLHFIEDAPIDTIFF